VTVGLVVLCLYCLPYLALAFLNSNEGDSSSQTAPTSNTTSNSPLTNTSSNSVGQLQLVQANQPAAATATGWHLNPFIAVSGVFLLAWAIGLAFEAFGHWVYILLSLRKQRKLENAQVPACWLVRLMHFFHQPNRKLKPRQSYEDRHRLTKLMSEIVFFRSCLLVLLLTFCIAPKLQIWKPKYSKWGMVIGVTAFLSKKRQFVEFQNKLCVTENSEEEALLPGTQA
jgi:hypothetical protein